MHYVSVEFRIAQSVAQSHDQTLATLVYTLFGGDHERTHRSFKTRFTATGSGLRQ
jgi:hypothetical protein